MTLQALGYASKGMLATVSSTVAMARVIYRKDKRCLATISFEHFGSPSSNLKCSTQEDPLSKPVAAGEAKVSFTFGQVSYEDIRQIQGTSFARFSPGIAGTTAVGTVSSIPPEETILSVKDPVLAIGSGLWTSTAVVPTLSLVKLPPQMKLEEAATIPSYLAAYIILNKVGRVTAGDKVLQTDGGSPLGPAIDAVGKALGVSVLSVPLEDLDKHAVMKKIPKDMKLTITGSAKHSSVLQKVLLPGGSLVVHTESESNLLKDNYITQSTARCIFSDVTVAGFDLASWVTNNPQEYAESASIVLELVSSKKISLKPVQSYPASDCTKAVSDLEKMGKAVILKL